MSEEEHYLSSFLEERLPELGLDYETYGPYIIGSIAQEEDELISEDILELLRASSESHGDNDEAWKRLQSDIADKQKQHDQSIKEKEQEELKQRKQHEHDVLQKEIELAKQKQLEDELEEAAPKPELDETKRAVVARYAYDESEEYDHEGNLKTKPEPSTGASQNKQEAANAHTEDARKIRQAHNTNKKTEREKTKQAKEAKKNLKEERRKRATKGERRR